MLNAFNWFQSLLKWGGYLDIVAIAAFATSSDYSITLFSSAIWSRPSLTEWSLLYKIDRFVVLIAIGDLDAINVAI